MTRKTSFPDYLPHPSAESFDKCLVMSPLFECWQNLVDTTQVCEENQQADGRKGSKMDGPNAHSKEKEKKKKGCLTKISNFITGSMEKGFYRSGKFFFYLHVS